MLMLISSAPSLTVFFLDMIRTLLRRDIVGKDESSVVGIRDAPTGNRASFHPSPCENPTEIRSLALGLCDANGSDQQRNGDDDLVRSAQQFHTSPSPRVKDETRRRRRLRR